MKYQVKFYEVEKFQTKSSVTYKMHCVATYNCYSWKEVKAVMETADSFDGYTITDFHDVLATGGCMA